MIIRLTLFGPPRTAKNSPIIIPRLKNPVLLPSPAYKEWTTNVLTQKPLIHSAIGAHIPIRTPVSLQCLIYREALTGDAVGYYQAIADVLQSEVWTCQGCNRKTVAESVRRCSHCGHVDMKRSRKGLGVIEDDKLIVDWNKSELLKDAARPRVELAIQVLAAPQVSLFQEKEEGVLV